MSVPQSEAFKKAVQDSKKLTSKPSNDDLLQLYGKLAPTTPTPNTRQQYPVL
jgi:acyl-CoA-binding protein